MTDKTQPEALRLALSIDLMDTFTDYQQEELNKAAAELRRQHARIAELEAELEAVGAGGVQALSAARPDEDKVRSVIGPLLNEFGERQWQSGAKVPHKSIEDAFDAIVAAATALAASPTPPAEQQAAPKAAPGESQNCGRCCGSGEDPAGYYDQSRGDAGATFDGPCRECNGTGAAPQQEAQEPSRAAKTWCSYVAGMIGCYLNEPDESTKVQAIAGIIERRLWALPTPQPAPAPLIARSLAEWHEDDGCVAWWAWNGREWAGEPAWIGNPNCEDWPGYHTHWTPHPDQPVFSALAAQGGKV